MTAGEKLAAAAEGLVGTPFRLHGRDPASGLDCVGLLGAALEACGRPVRLPQGYSLRARWLPDLSVFVRDCGLAPTSGDLATGDVILVHLEPCQHHVMIATLGGRLVHAHAGLGRVIRCDGPPDGQIIHHWRFAASD